MQYVIKNEEGTRAFDYNQNRSTSFVQNSTGTHIRFIPDSHGNTLGTLVSNNNSVISITDSNIACSTDSTTVKLRIIPCSIIYKISIINDPYAKFLKINTSGNLSGNLSGDNQGDFFQLLNDTKDRYTNIMRRVLRTLDGTKQFSFVYNSPTKYDSSCGPKYIQFIPNEADSNIGRLISSDLDGVIGRSNALNPYICVDLNGNAQYTVLNVKIIPLLTTLCSFEILGDNSIKKYLSYNNSGLIVSNNVKSFAIQNDYIESSTKGMRLRLKTSDQLNEFGYTYRAAAVLVPTETSNYLQFKPDNANTNDGIIVSNNNYGLINRNGDSLLCGELGGWGGSNGYKPIKVRKTCIQPILGQIPSYECKPVTVSEPTIVPTVPQPTTQNDLIQCTIPTTTPPPTTTTEPATTTTTEPATTEPTTNNPLDANLPPGVVLNPDGTYDYIETLPDGTVKRTRINITRKRTAVTFPWKRSMAATDQCNPLGTVVSKKDCNNKSNCIYAGKYCYNITDKKIGTISNTTIDCVTSLNKNGSYHLSFKSNVLEKLFIIKRLDFTLKDNDNNSANPFLNATFINLDTARPEGKDNVYVIDTNGNLELNIKISGGSVSNDYNFTSIVLTDINNKSITLLEENSDYNTIKNETTEKKKRETLDKLVYDNTLALKTNNMDYEIANQLNIFVTP
jgi:hypothetical protein